MKLIIDEVAISGMLERYRSALEKAERTKQTQLKTARHHFDKIVAEADLMYDGKTGVAFEVLKAEVIEARKKSNDGVLHEAQKN